MHIYVHTRYNKGFSSCVGPIVERVRLSVNLSAYKGSF